MEHRTTESLRDLLFQTIDDVRSGRMSANDAAAVGKLSNQVIETAKLEIQYAEACIELDALGITPGKLLLTEKKSQ